MKNIDENAPDDVIRVLVGNKSDLHDRIVISTQDGKKLADKYHVEFFETSAKSDTNLNITKIFYCLSQKIIDQQQITPSLPKSDVYILNDKSESTYDRLVGCCSSTTSAIINN